MTERPRVQSRPVPVQERACLVGAFLAINGYRARQTSLKQRLAEGGYQVQETPHFLCCRRALPPQTIIVHRFAPETIDVDLGAFFMEELRPLGVLNTAQDFADLFGAVVGSLSPRDPQQAWLLYGRNTFRRYCQMVLADQPPPFASSPLTAFATLYHRVCRLIVGDSLLDAGCSFGMLPLIAAAACPSLHRVVGVDIQAGPFATVEALAAERHWSHISYRQADLLNEQCSQLGRFDTVACLHVLEHFTEEQMYLVLHHMVQMTRERLILAVPYEAGVPEHLYGHQQCFSQATFEAAGHWCLAQWGTGRMHYEDCAGGLLVLDRHASL